MLRFVRRFTSKGVLAGLQHADPSAMISAPRLLNNRYIQHCSKVLVKDTAVLGRPFKIEYDPEDYIDVFNNPMKLYHRGTCVLSNEDIEPTEMMVKIANEEQAEELMNLRKVNHPYILKLIALIRTKPRCEVPKDLDPKIYVASHIAIIDFIKCTFESYMAEEGRRLKMCISHTDSSGTQTPTILSPLAQSFIRKLIVGVFVASEASLSVKFDDNLFICSPLNLTTFDIKLGRLVGKQTDVLTNLEGLKAYLQRALFQPLGLDDTELVSAFTVPSSKMFKESDMIEMFKKPLFHTIYDRFSFIFTMNDKIFSMGAKNAELFLETHISAYRGDDWKSSIETNLFTEMNKLVKYKNTTNLGFMRFERNGLGHQCATINNLQNYAPPAPNVLGDTMESALLYFHKLRPKFYLQLYECQSNFTYPMKRVR